MEQTLIVYDQEHPETVGGIETRVYGTAYGPFDAKCTLERCIDKVGRHANARSVLASYHVPNTD